MIDNMVDLFFVRCGRVSEVDDTDSRTKRQTTSIEDDKQFTYDPDFDPEVGILRFCTALIHLMPSSSILFTVKH